MTPERLTRLLSYALRHGPTDYGLTLGGEGWIDLDLLISALKKHNADMSGLEVSDVESLVRDSDVARFELRDGRIRATYGHSAVELAYGLPRAPPPVLYHVTRAAFVPSIASNGLQGRRRRFVHLTSSWRYALRLHRAREAQHVESAILVVDSIVATAAGISFYEASNEVWLCTSLPPNALSLAFLKSQHDDLPPESMLPLVPGEPTKLQLKNIMQSQIITLFDT
jgi:putative RNA 2'-phosphotransferase